MFHTNKRFLSIIVFVILSVLLLGLLNCFLRKDNYNKTGNNLSSKETFSSLNEPSSSTQPLSEVSIPNESSNLQELINEDNNYTKNLLDFNYTILDAFYSKENKELTVPSNHPDNILFNNDGTLESNHNYIGITLKIDNLTDKLEEITLNSHYLYVYDGDTLISQSELITIDQNSHLKNSREFFRWEMNPQDSQTFVLGYIIDDNLINESYSYVIYLNPTGVGKLFGGNEEDLSEYKAYIDITNLLF